MSRWFRRSLTAVGLLVLAIVTLLPVLLIVRQSLTPRHLAGLFPAPLLPPEPTLDPLIAILETQSLWVPLVRSLFVASAATALSLALALPAGWALARSRWFGAAGLHAALLTRVLPPIAIALPLAAWLTRLGLGNQPSGIGLVLAHVSAILPLAILVIAVSCRALPVALEEAAEIDGAGRLVMLRRVILPLLRGAMAAAGLLGFLYSWDDFTHAIVIQITHETLPPRIAYIAQHGDLGQASALALVMLIPAAVVMASLSRLLMRSGGLSLSEKE